MIEKIGTEEGRYISTFCKDFVNLTKKKKEENKSVRIAEVGVGIGATTVETVKYLNEDDEYYLFDFDTVVSELKADLATTKAKLIGIGNSTKTYDSFLQLEFGKACA